MPFVRVKPDDMAQVTAVACIQEAGRQVDDPDAFPVIPEMLAGKMRYGWDLEPSEIYLYLPKDATEPLGVLALDLPTRDNLHLVWAQILVHPDHRRRGHGSVIMNEALRIARSAGRTRFGSGPLKMIRVPADLLRNSALCMPATTLAGVRSWRMSIKPRSSDYGNLLRQQRQTTFWSASSRRFRMRF
jgi:GNAT superfamily N-acetyltransferase